MKTLLMRIYIRYRNHFLFKQVRPIVIGIVAIGVFFSALLDPNLGMALEIHRNTTVANTKNTYLPILWEAQQNWTEKIGELISAGYKVDINDSNGDQPLHWAARHGNAEIAKMLLTAGAKIDAVDNNGDQPIHWAARYGNYGDTEIFKILLAAGAKLDQLNNQGESANSISKHIGPVKGEVSNSKGSLDEAAINFIKNNLSNVFIRAKMCSGHKGRDSCEEKTIITCYQRDSLRCDLYGVSDENVIKEVTQSFQNSGLRISTITFWRSTHDNKSIFEKSIYIYRGLD